MFATSCVYLLIEVQPRYAYAGQIAVFILMAGGAQVLGSLWETVTANGGRGSKSRRASSPGNNVGPGAADRNRSRALFYR